MNRSRYEVEQWWLKLSDWHMEFISLFSLLCVCLKKKMKWWFLSTYESSAMYIYTHRHIPEEWRYHFRPIWPWFYHICLTIHPTRKRGLWHLSVYPTLFIDLSIWVWSHFCFFLVSKWELRNWNTSPLHWVCQ